mgnify:CR=1 FL=1
MFARERHEAICEMLKQQRSVTVAELVEKFGVSVETVRRDLAYLEKRRQLTRVHGGAIAVSDKMRHFSALSERMSENAEKKRKLSETAATLVSENDVIAIDSGSTANIFIRVLCEKFEKLTIVTYSQDIIEAASDKSGFSIIMLGGYYMPSERVFYGFLTDECLKHVHVSKAFIFPSALSLKYGITINIGEFYNLQRGLMRISDRCYVLADSTKFENASPIRLCELDEPNGIVTDSGLDEQIYRQYKEKGINLII